jgi:hypothetical protein
MLAAEQGLHLRRLVEQRLGLGQQRAAVLVEHQPAADAVEQQGADRAFEVGRALLAADCERAMRSAAARVLPPRAVATKTSSWRRLRRRRVEFC